MSTRLRPVVEHVNAQSWTTADAADLYRVASWGEPYFFVNDNGLMAVRSMDESGTTIDIAAVVDTLRDRGVQFPMLIRFQDILRSQVRRLNEAFGTAISESRYPSRYCAVYPIKVNQLHEVVDELLDAGREFGMGLECGSKAELIASLPQVDGDTLLICNGVKDREMLSLIMAGQQLGQNIIPVVERFAEFADIKSLSFSTGFFPKLGVRIRLATPGSGRWSESSGVNSKFGLSAAEVVRIVDELQASGMSRNLVLLHCHIGSQIADIQVLKQATKEVSHVYAELMRRGCPIKYLDLGGGLGVNYDSSDLDEEGGINYSLQEYANAVVSNVKEVCDARKIDCPILVTESGRALTAHHSALIVPVLGSRTRVQAWEATEIGDDPPELVLAMQRALDSLATAKRSDSLLEAYHVANERLQEARSLFALGYMSLEQRASAETLYWQICRNVLDAMRQVPDLGVPEVAEIEALLTDLYLCDFSVFQSMLDHWAIGQPFPIVPLSRLDEPPTRRGLLVDLTCDSDGKVTHYVSSQVDNQYLPVHELRDGEPYYLGFFLMGAYEDIVGDAHNLFGRVSEAHVYADAEEPGNFWIEKIIPGTAIQDMLAQVQYFPNDLHRRMSELVRGKIREGVVRPTEGMKILDQYMVCFSRNTYCNPNDVSMENER